jgi:hypothetical protein
MLCFADQDNVGNTIEGFDKVDQGGGSGSLGGNSVLHVSCLQKQGHVCALLFTGKKEGALVLRLPLADAGRTEPHPDTDERWKEANAPFAAAQLGQQCDEHSGNL